MHQVGRYRPFIINQTYSYIAGGNNGYVYKSSKLPAVDLKTGKDRFV